MELFWHWLIKMNVRAVFVLVSGCVVLLALTGIPQFERTTGGPARSLAVSELGVPGDGFRVTGEIRLPKATKDPFCSDYLEKLTIDEEKRQRLLAEASRRDAELAAAAATLSEEAVENPPVVVATNRSSTGNVKVPVVLLYRGLITRTDGVTVAMMRNQASGEVVSCVTGDTFAGFKVAEISINQVVLLGKDDSRHVLQVDTQITLEQ